MNIMNRVTIKSLMKNKVRTVVTIVGIILAAAMFTAVTTFISSLQSYMYNVSVDINGSWHAVLYSTENAKLSELEKDSRISKIVENPIVGYSKLSNSKNADKPYIYVMSAGNDFFSSMPVKLTTGSLPKNSNEIILPDHLQKNGGVKYNLGEKIMLNLGQREAAGITLQQTSPYDKSEKLTNEQEKEYIVTGFYSRPRFENQSAPGYTAITFNDKSISSSFQNAYITFKNPQDTFTFLNEQSKKSGFMGGDDNQDVLTYMGVSKYNAFYNVLYGFAGILIGLIMLGSVSLIYNAFSISVSERTKQYGLLSSVGATKRQLRKSVLFEAFAVSVIGIPIGILSGIAGIGVTLYCLRGAFNSFAADSSSNIGLVLHVNLPSIFIAAAVAIITVLISALIPSRRATKITAIEAIRQSNDIKASRKQVKVSKLTYKLFGLEGMLAKKHFKRNKRKYRATVISLCMSVVLFVSASTFCHYMKKSFIGIYNTPEFDVVYTTNYSTGENDTQRIYSYLKNADNVTRSSMISLVSGTGKFADGMLTEDYRKNHNNSNEANIYIGVIDDNSYKQYLKENGLSEDKYMNTAHPLGIAKKSVSYIDREAGKKVSYDVLKNDSFKLDAYILNVEKQKSFTEAQEKEYFGKDVSENPCYERKILEIGHVSDKLIKGTNGSDADGITIIYPQSVYAALNLSGSISNNMCIFDSSNSSKTYDSMTTMLNNNSDTTSGLQDYVKTTEVMRNMLLVINVFSYGFIILISLIAAANVFNTISTNISLRRREFAMLKTVGMTKRGFNKMMNMECLLYGLKSLAFGLPISLLLSYLIYMTGSQGYLSGFDFPWQSMLIAVISVFAVVFSTMLYSMSKIKKENPIDALKNENM